MSDFPVPEKFSWADFFIRYFGSGRLDQDHLRPLRGVSFGTMRRRLYFYGRSFWDTEVRLASTGHGWSEREGRRPHWQDGVLYLPETFESTGGGTRR
jgi:hypothetical protein